MTTDIKKNPKIQQDIDVSENSLLMSDPDILATLLKDRTTGGEYILGRPLAKFIDHQ